MEEISELKNNLIERVKITQGCLDDVNKQAAAVELCKRDVLFFFKYFLWTYDPRKSPSEIPFIPYDFQEKHIEELNEDIAKGESSLTEKSRDMGVTWMILGVFVYRWLFFNENFLLGSRKEQFVDKLGDMDTHFERCRFILKHLPDWMVKGCGWDREKDGYLKIYKENGAALVGEAMTKDFSRQGRQNAILLDEFAFVDQAEQVWRSCGDSAPCKVVVSTPNGNVNFFAKLRASGKIKVHTLHWRMHPDKNEEWYEKQKKDRSDKDVAQELDINYTVSAGDPFYMGFVRALHLRQMNINKEKELILGFDYGFRHPNCIVCQLSVEGRFIIVDNIFGEDQTIDEFGEYAKRYLAEKYEGYRWGHRCYGDPAGKQSSDKSRKSSEQILRELGFNIKSISSNTSYTGYANRKVIIEKMLRTLIKGIPSLVINDVPSNNIIVEGFEGGYRYPNANNYGGVSEKPVEDNWFEHPFNSLEYVIINMFKPIEKKKHHRVSQKQPVNAGGGF